MFEVLDDCFWRKIFIRCWQRCSISHLQEQKIDNLKNISLHWPQNIIRSDDLNCFETSSISLFLSFVDELLSGHTSMRHGSWESNLVGALLSGFVVAVVINPLDVVTTRLYNQPSSSSRLYSGYVDCVLKIAGKEGVSAFYKGLTAQYFRIGPHSFLSLIFWHHTRSSLGLLK